jgi:PAS domain S-box-containing protein
MGAWFRDAKTADMERSRSWKQYLPALLFVSTATGIKLLAFGVLGPQMPFTLFYTAVVASAWAGGFGPGLLATFLASMIGRFFFLAPLHSFSVSSVTNTEREFFFGLEGILLSAFSGKYAGARRLAVSALTQIRLYEQRLKQSIEDVRALRLTSAEDVVWEWDIPHDRMIRGATRVERPQASVSAMNFASWLNHIHPEDRSEVSASIDTVLRQGREEWHCEYRRLHSGGRFSNVCDHAFVFRDASRNPERMVGRTVTLSRSKRPAHLPGVLGNDRHETIVEDTPIAVLVTDVFLRILSANQAAKDVLGYSAEGLRGMPLENLFVPETRQRIANRLSDLNPSDHPLAGLEEDCLRGDGKMFRGKINSAAILNSDGSTGRVILIEHLRH